MHRFISPKPLRPRASDGFTLIEILIGIVIIGILLAVALPSYNSQQVKARRSDCQASLVGFAQAMEKHYALNYSYLAAANEGADTGTPASTVFPSQCPASGDAFYTLRIQAATSNTYTLRAVPVAGKSQSADGLLEINSLGQRFWDRNNDNDTEDGGEDKWSS
jgi:type IV pilus assembly protein PilE